MNVEIRSVNKEVYARVHAFQCEYLDDESFDDFMNRVEANNDLYLTAFVSDELAGICYGEPSHNNEAAINLQGIAVNLDETKNFARVGIGSKLVAKFEEAVKRRGNEKIALGAADDLKVEHFYLKNGFTPCELVAKGSRHEEYERIQIKDYTVGKAIQEQLRRKYNPKEVIFIFEKSIE